MSGAGMGGPSSGRRWEQDGGNSRVKHTAAEIIMSLIEGINDRTQGPELHRMLNSAFGDKPFLRFRRGNIGSMEQMSLSKEIVPKVGEVITVSYYGSNQDSERVELQLAHSGSAHDYFDPKPKSDYGHVVHDIKDMLTKDWGYLAVNLKMWAGDRTKNGLQLIE